MIFKQNFDFRSPLHLCSLLGLARREVRQDVYRTSDEPSPHPAVSPPVTRYSLCRHLLERKFAGENSWKFLDVFPCHKNYLSQDILVTAEDCKEGSKVRF